MRNKAKDRWLSLKPKARRLDPQLGASARAVDAARLLIQKRDKALRLFLGGNLWPESGYVLDQVMSLLEKVEVPLRLDNSGPLLPRSAADMAPGGKHSKRLFNEIRNAAYRARNVRQKKALDYFTSAAGGGWTKEQAVGIVAGLTIESNLDPGKEQVPGSRFRYGYGAAQWELGKGRDAEFARLMKRPLVGSSFEQQLAFINYELQHSAVYKSAGDALRGAKTAAEAARIAASQYERMAHKEQREVRAREAMDIYKEFYGKR